MKKSEIVVSAIVGGIVLRKGISIGRKIGKLESFKDRIEGPEKEKTFTEFFELITDPKYHRAMNKKIDKIVKVYKNESENV